VAHAAVELATAGDQREPPFVRVRPDRIDRQFVLGCLLARVHDERDPVTAVVDDVHAVTGDEVTELEEHVGAHP
jgi:hypothetical protein